VELKPGTKLRSAVCEAEFIVVRAPATGVELACGGAPLLTVDEEKHEGLAIAPDLSGGSLLGKRYVDEDLGLEVLCTKSGDGSLSGNGSPLEMKGAKPLPASD
jgi:hypothetical protein